MSDFHYALLILAESLTGREEIHQQEVDTSDDPLVARLQLYRAFLIGHLRIVTALRERNEAILAWIREQRISQARRGLTPPPEPEPPPPEPEPQPPRKLTALQRRRLAEMERQEIDAETHRMRNLEWCDTPPPYFAPPPLFTLAEKIAALPDDIVEPSIPFEEGDSWVIAWREWIEFGPSEEQLREAVTAITGALEHPELIEDAEALEKLRVERVPVFADYRDMWTRFHEQERREREERIRARKAAKAAKALASAQLPAEGVSEADDEAESKPDRGNGEVP